jgi:KaiC/GvpD/RAD55 family RecA-like ATPase
LIVETKQIPKIYSPTGVEEFLADGVVVFYNYRKGNTRDTAIEIIKMRGEKHQKKIVEIKVTDLGVIVYPENVITDIRES